MLDLIIAQPAHVKWVSSAIGVALIAFLGWFLLPAALQFFKLVKVRRYLEQNQGPHASLDAAFVHDKTLKHLWDEYADTLHEQRELNPETVQFETVARRSTVPAEAIFTTQTLVDTPLKTEFFKHLPGILTGLGIIGTFTGLIIGLTAFRVSANPTEVRNGLNLLLGGVKEAFYVSAGAIAFAMATTFFEKLIVTALYKQVEKICQLLDSRYQAGAGEEYLSRLVIASEASAKEAKHLKQALVQDLKGILEELTERQIRASNDISASLADQIVKGMETGLAAPLSTIGTAVQQLGGNQGEAINKMLIETMTAMTAQIRDLFGSQVTGINQMQQETVAAMTAAMTKLQEMVSVMGTTSQEATEQMAEKLAKAIEAMEGRQKAMEEQVQQLVGEVKSSVGDMSTQTNQKLQDALSQVATSVQTMVGSIDSIVKQAAERDQARGDLMDKNTASLLTAVSGEIKTLIAEMSATGKAGTDQMTDRLAKAIEAMENRQSMMEEQVRKLVSEVQNSVGKMGSQTTDNLQAALAKVADSVQEAVGKLHGIVDQAAERDAERGERIRKNTDEAVNGLSGEVKALLAEVSTASKQMSEAVTAMQRITTESVDKMNAGANRLYSASEQFATAGHATVGVLDRAQVVAQKMTETSGALTGSATSLNGAMKDFKSMREALSGMVAALNTAVGNAKNEAALTENILKRIEGSAQALQKAQLEADKYLTQVSQVLTDAHQTFGTQVISTLKEVNGEFHSHLTSATSALAGAIEDLEGVFDKIPD